MRLLKELLSPSQWFRIQLEGKCSCWWLLVSFLRLRERVPVCGGGGFVSFWSSLRRQGVAGEKLSGMEVLRETETEDM